MRRMRNLIALADKRSLINDGQ